MYFILIILLLWFLVYTSNKENFEETTIAIVGNGPLSNKDRKNINEFDMVYRFNSLNSYTVGDKIDILCVRQCGKTDTVFGLDNKYTIKNNVNVNNILVIGTRHNIANKIKERNPNKNVEMLDIYEKYICDYESCNVHDNKIIFDRKVYTYDTLCGPSSGFHLIMYVLNKYPHNNIHIFGMNWNGIHICHNGNLEKELINNCKRCIIHPS